MLQSSLTSTKKKTENWGKNSQCPWESTSLNQYCCGIWYVFHFHQTSIDIFDPSRLIRHVVERIWMGQKRTRREKCLNVTKFRSIFDNIRYIMTNHRPCFLLPSSPAAFFFSTFPSLFVVLTLANNWSSQPRKFFEKRFDLFSSTASVVSLNKRRAWKVKAKYYSCAKKKEETNRYVACLRMFISQYIQIQNVVISLSQLSAQFKFTLRLFQSLHDRIDWNNIQNMNIKSHDKSSPNILRYFTDWRRRKKSNIISKLFTLKRFLPFASRNQNKTVRKHSTLNWRAEEEKKANLNIWSEALPVLKFRKSKQI